GLRDGQEPIRRSNHRAKRKGGMSMTKITVYSLRVCLLSGFVILLLALACSAETPRKRVSVMDFEFGTVQRWWDGNWDIGKGISDLLVERLLSEGTFSVIERRKLDMVLAEQNFSTS